MEIIKVAALRIKQRIINALNENGGSMEYANLMYKVFPIDQYPRAMQYNPWGGPPGCAMAFGRALREMEVDGKLRDSPHKFGRKISLRQKMRTTHIIPINIPEATHD
jgi:hypothetical protein